MRLAFHFRTFSATLALLALASVSAFAAAAAAPAPAGSGVTAAADGSVSGTIVDQATSRPVEYVTITLKKATGEVVATSATGPKGTFEFAKLPPGDYRVSYAPLGSDPQESSTFTVDASHRSVDLGSLTLASTAVKMEKVEVKSTSAAILNSIDRKVYNVGKDLQSTSGSAADLLQNVPSVQVDIDGNVALRGNQNVLILIDGKPSALMSTTNRPDVLEQMPADSIDKIEVITNPSAKFKPDGTAGIINITMKKKRDPGYSGSVRASVGNDSRYNVSLSGNYRPGAYNVFANFSLRQDDRLRYVNESRSHLDAPTGAMLSTYQYTVEHMRPLSRLGQMGVDYDVSKDDKVGASVDYNLRTFYRTSTISNLSRGGTGAVTSDYDRLRTDPEWQKTLSFTGTWRHSFATEGQELSTEIRHERHQEQEDNHYSDVYRTPVTPTTFDTTSIKPTETNTELTSDFETPLPHDAKLESGYSGEFDKNDMDFRVGNLDPVSGQWVTDRAQTNRFIYKDSIHAFYTTYGRAFGNFGLLGGLRLEQAYIDTNQVSTGVIGHNNYFRLYPTLHLSYNVSETGQLQLNYSHRIHRPESDDLNPFPEYQDPYNLREGNPNLKPEDTHSIEAGYQYRKDDTTYLAAVYFRDTYHGFTTVTRYIDAVTLLTTHENLATNKSGGLELTATRDIGAANVNFSANAYENQIDASNLGFSSSRSTFAWDAKLNVNYKASKTTQIQFNTNYTATRLTPQGERRPTFIANLGLRHDLKDKKTAVVLTVSDLFDSLKERTVIDTPTLHDDITRRRSSRIVYLGFIYNFGKQSKKQKDDALKFDNAL